MAHYIPDATDDDVNLIQAQQLLLTPQIKEFIFAGNATFTLRSKRTGRRFTYKVTQASRSFHNGRKDQYFCKLLNGPNNEGDFAYFGMIYGSPKTQLKYVHGKPDKACAMKSAPSVQGFMYFMGHLVDHDSLPPDVEFWHEGRCGMCGRKLTDPVSIDRGFGPECVGKLGG